MHEDTVLKIRKFNRFYLSEMNFYESGYAGSHYSITECRVLYEIFEHEACNADYIAKKLHLDKGYLSRIIKAFENRGMIVRQRSQADARSYEIRLTGEGQRVIGELIQNANREIEDEIKPLSESDCGALEQAMNTIQEILTKRRKK